ncbi:unnamed protein product [Schistocephalus solidus]|uniref:Uncharacterized protein n=1 Tax=Schistocephalus solidus TaxID=70667 RepID=A0A183SY57_SCHSO|nr:unnamed protein product [Schistocephalus solidus]
MVADVVFIVVKRDLVLTACASEEFEGSELDDSRCQRRDRGHQQGVQVLLEIVLRRIRACHQGSVGADDGGKRVSPKRQTEAHQAILDPRGKQGRRPTMPFRMAKVTPAPRHSALGQPLQKKVWSAPTSSS